MATINVADDFYGELEALGRTRGFTPEVLAHKLLQAGVEHMRGIPQLEMLPESMRKFNEELAMIIEAKGDIANAVEDLGTAVRGMEVVRNQIGSDASAATVFNDMLGPPPEPGGEQPIEGRPDVCPLPMPGPNPGPVDPNPQPGEHHCFECDKQEVCEIKAKMDSIVTHRMISLFGESIDNLWRNVAKACDAFWPVGGYPIRPLHEATEGTEVIGHIGEDGQMHPAENRIGGHDDLGSRHTDAQSTVTGVRGNIPDGGSPGESEGSR